VLHLPFSDQHRSLVRAFVGCGRGLEGGGWACVGVPSGFVVDFDLLLLRQLLCVCSFMCFENSFFFIFLVLCDSLLGRLGAAAHTHLLGVREVHRTAARTSRPQRQRQNRNRLRRHCWWKVRKGKLRVLRCKLQQSLGPTIFLLVPIFFSVCD